jgi:hypothetical protein
MLFASIGSTSAHMSHNMYSRNFFDGFDNGMHKLILYFYIVNNSMKFVEGKGNTSNLLAFSWCGMLSSTFVLMWHALQYLCSDVACSSVPFF